MLYAKKKEILIHNFILFYKMSIFSKKYVLATYLKRVFLFNVFLSIGFYDDDMDHFSHLLYIVFYHSTIQKVDTIHTHIYIYKNTIEASI